MTDKRISSLTGYVLATIVVTIIIVVLILPKADSPQQNPNLEQNSQTETPQATEQEPEKAKQELPENGIITGSFSYPGDKIPETIKACALNVETKAKVCTDKHIKKDSFIYGVGYSLELPNGEYELYAIDTANSGNPHTNVMAHHNSYSATIKSKEWPEYPECSDINTLTVEILGSETIDNITLGDWYYEAQC